MTDGGRLVHDLGGREAGPIPKDEQHDYALWEKRVDALLVLLSARGLLKVDELRRAVEQLGPGAYDELSYYERWIAAIAQVMLERGVLTSDELGRRMAEIEARVPAEG